MREQRDPFRVADVEIRQRLGLRRDQIVGRAFSSQDERRGQTMRAGFDVDRCALDGQAARNRLAHSGIDVEKRDLPLVDRNLNLLADRREAEQASAEGAEEGQLETIGPVCRERVNDRQPAARAGRRAVDVRHLRDSLRHGVANRRRRGLRIPDGEAADLAGGVEIALHQRRRKVLHSGNVVEVVADCVGRQPLRDVDLETEQRADRARVLNPVQSLRDASAGIRMKRRRFVDPPLERNDKRIEGRLIGTPRGGRRRHHPGANLRDRALGEIDILRHFLNRGVLERHAAGLAGVSVTLCADRAEDGRLRFRRHTIGLVREGDDRRFRLSLG
jgi:hypothetical protein